MSDDLAAWLLEQIAADETVARTAAETCARGDARSSSSREPVGPFWDAEGGMVSAPTVDGYGVNFWDCEGSGSLCMADEHATHIAHWDPARVLAECEAKRRIVEDATQGGDCQGHPGSYQPHGEYGPGYCRDFSDNQYLRLLALPYADRPGYREEWSVS